MVTIYKNPNGDTRTAPKNISFEEFEKANDMHINDVRNVMKVIGQMLIEAGEKHDYTKKMFESLFYENFLSTINDGTDFVSNQWYQIHIHNERHHIDSYCHDDVNLIDIIEMIVDCVCAGLARSGKIRDMNINPEILQLSINNTVDLITKMIDVKEFEE